MTSSLMIPARPVKPEPPHSKNETQGRHVRVHREIVKSVEAIGPDEAAKILEEQTDNRDVTQKKVADYARQMTDGRWMLNGEPIIFDWFDRLLDGQHRLWAVIESGKTIKFDTTRGVDPAVFVTIDTGRSRDAKDLLSIRKEKDTLALAGTLRLLWLWELYEQNKGILSQRKGDRKRKDEEISPITRRWTTSMSPSPREIEEVLNRHPEIRDFLRMARTGNKIIPPGPLAYVLYQVSKKARKDEVERFHHFLCDGAGMNVDDPLFRIHKRFREQKMTKVRRKAGTIETLAILIKGWNLSRHGKRISQIVWREDEDMPELTF